MTSVARVFSRSLKTTTAQPSRVVTESAASSKPSSWTWDGKANRFVKRARTVSSRQRALQELAERAQKASEGVSIIAPSSSSSGVLPAGSAGDASFSTSEADRRKRYQERKYTRGQHDSTLKVAVDLFEGVQIPSQKPLPPPADTCCMSGCPRCVYDVFTADRELYHEALDKARTELRAKSIPEETWPDEVRPTKASASRSTGSAVDRAFQEVDEEIRDLDVSLRTFLQFERRLRRKRAAEQSSRIALQHVSGISEGSLQANF